MKDTGRAGRAPEVVTPTYVPTYLARKVRGGVREGARAPPHLRRRARARHHAAPRGRMDQERGCATAGSTRRRRRSSERRRDASLPRPSALHFALLARPFACSLAARRRFAPLDSRIRPLSVFQLDERRHPHLLSRPARIYPRPIVVTAAYGETPKAPRRRNRYALSVLFPRGSLEDAQAGKPGPIDVQRTSQVVTTLSPGSVLAAFSCDGKVRSAASFLLRRARRSPTIPNDWAIHLSRVFPCLSLRMRWFVAATLARAIRGVMVDRFISLRSRRPRESQV